MLLRAQVHGVGKIVADEDRHPDVGLARAQSLGKVVLCPKHLIDSSLLVTFLAYRNARCKIKMACAARRRKRWYLRIMREKG